MPASSCAQARSCPATVSPASRSAARAASNSALRSPIAREDRLQIFDDSGDHRPERVVAGDAGAQAFDLRRPLGAIALGPLDAATLGPQLGVELSPTAGTRTLVRRRPAALDRGG